MTAPGPGNDAEGLEVGLTPDQQRIAALEQQVATLSAQVANLAQFLAQQVQQQVMQQIMAVATQGSGG